MRKPGKRELTKEMWRTIDPLLRELKLGSRGGRPCADNRQVFEGIPWILRPGARSAPCDRLGQTARERLRINRFFRRQAPTL
jgi:transposase